VNNCCIRLKRRAPLTCSQYDYYVQSCFWCIVTTESRARSLSPWAGRVQFHHTRKHASWLNMAEIEISILERQCLDRRLMDRATAQREVNAWQRQRNAERCGIDWTFSPKTQSEDSLVTMVLN